MTESTVDLNALLPELRTELSDVDGVNLDNVSDATLMKFLAWKKR